MIEYANEDLASNSNFTVSFYYNEPSEENLDSIFGYNGANGFAYSYEPEANLDVYKRTVGTYWYDRDDKLWYRDDSVLDEDIPNSLHELIERLDVLKYKFELSDEKVFNATNCYVLTATIEGLESYTEYYITKDTYTLIGTKQQLTQEDIPFYALINYDSNIELPDAAKNAENASYSEYLNKKTNNEYLEIYQSLFGELPD